MYSNFKLRYPLLSLALIFFFIATACGSSTTVTPTSIPSPTPVPPTATLTASPTPEPIQTSEPTTTPLPKIDLNIELPEGDAKQGFVTAVQYRCHGCHVLESNPNSGPRFTADAEMPFILERGTIWMALPEYAGRATTNQEYMIEAIFLADAFIVPGEWEKTMPASFHEKMTDQELADILAWIVTLE